MDSLKTAARAMHLGLGLMELEMIHHYNHSFTVGMEPINFCSQPYSKAVLKQILHTKHSLPPSYKGSGVLRARNVRF